MTTPPASSRLVYSVVNDVGETTAHLRHSSDDVLSWHVACDVSAGTVLFAEQALATVLAPQHALFRVRRDDPSPSHAHPDVEWELTYEVLVRARESNVVEQLPRTSRSTTTLAMLASPVLAASGDADAKTRLRALTTKLSTPYAWLSTILAARPDLKRDDVLLAYDRICEAALVVSSAITGVRMGVALVSSLAYARHSCAPSGELVWCEGGDVVVEATRNLVAGDEITIHRRGNSLLLRCARLAPASARRECECDECTIVGQQQQPMPPTPLLDGLYANEPHSALVRVLDARKRVIRAALASTPVDESALAYARQHGAELVAACLHEQRASEELVRARVARWNASLAFATAVACDEPLETAIRAVLAVTGNRPADAPPREYPPTAFTAAIRRLHVERLVYGNDK